MSLQAFPPEGCVIELTSVSCGLGALLEGESLSLDFTFSANTRGRRSMISAVAAYEDGFWESLLQDDKFSNNTSESIFTVVERSNFGLNVRGNQESFRYNDEFEFFLTLATNLTDTALANVDVYFAVETPEGSIAYIGGLEPIAVSLDPVSLLNNWNPISIPDTEVLRLILPNTVSTCTYTWSIILAETGTDVTDDANHLSVARFIHRLDDL